jgi:hypothetical protein
MIILITGGRDYNDREIVFETLDEIAAHAEGTEVKIVHGACGVDRADPFRVELLRGADRLAEAWAFEHQVQVMRIAAEWRRLGPSAGPVRNSEMVRIVVALQDSFKGCAVFPGGAGTKDCSRKAHHAGLAMKTGVRLKEWHS